MAEKRPGSESSDAEYMSYLRKKLESSGFDVEAIKKQKELSKMIKNIAENNVYFGKLTEEQIAEDEFRKNNPDLVESPYYNTQVTGSSIMPYMIRPLKTYWSTAHCSLIEKTEEGEFVKLKGEELAGAIAIETAPVYEKAESTAVYEKAEQTEVCEKSKKDDKKAQELVYIQ